MLKLISEEIYSALKQLRSLKTFLRESTRKRSNQMNVQVWVMMKIEIKMQFCPLH